MQFTKMNGIGNDFIVIYNESIPSQISLIAPKLCDRHFGIGADGMVFILPSDQADFQMRIYNSDGSEAEQCGNAIRCVGKYVYDHGLTDKTVINIETLAGIQTIELKIKNQKVEEICVNMGTPILRGQLIPTTINQDIVYLIPIEINHQHFQFTAVSIGNPHAVIEVEDAKNFPVQQIGPLLEVHPFFPNKTNVEFITIHNEHELTMRVWERGAGETLACGTGACAAVVSTVLSGKTARKVIVHLKGGDLQIEWYKNTNQIYMTGSATEVFVGEWFGI